jgi:hypothetical protein
MNRITMMGILCSGREPAVVKSNKPLVRKHGLLLMEGKLQAAESEYGRSIRCLIDAELGS